MRLEKLALVAEVVGSFAIILTLAVLIYETRQNTDATYAVSYDQLSRDLADWRMALAGNPEMQETYLTWMFRGDDRRLTPEDENDSGGLVADSLFLIYERAYYGHEYGRLAEEPWQRYKRAICGDTSNRLWSRIMPNLLTTEFQEFVERECFVEWQPE